VAVHLHSKKVKVTGGVIIDVTDLDQHDVQTWISYTGVEIVNGRAILYKALPADLTAGRGYSMPTLYAIGTEVTAVDWTDNNECGGGLHLSPTATQSTDYDRDAVRWVRCTVDLADIRPIVGGTAKCKVRTLYVEAEVNIHDRELAKAA
jgi:hypothetical protein